MPRPRIVVAAAAAAVAVLVAASTMPAGAAATTGLDPSAVAQAQLAGCQAWLAQHPGSTSAQHTRMVQCVSDEQAILVALAATPAPSPSSSPSSSPSPTVGPTTPAPTTVPPTSASPTPPAPTTPPPSPSPTPSPTAAAWPGPLNTGVPPGTALTTYTGPCTITTPGTLIDAKTINCDLSIRTHDVVITRSRINGSIGDGEPQNCAGCSFTLDQVEVNAGPETNPAVWHTTLTVLRSNVHGGQTAVSCVQACTVKDSWLHGQVHNPNVADQHFGGFLSNGGGTAATPSLIQHNTITCDVPQTTVGGGISSCSGDMNLFSDFGAVAYYTLDHNLFQSSGEASFCVYGGSSPGKPGGPGHHLVFTGNVMEHGNQIGDPGNNGGIKACAWWGAVADWDGSQPGNVWSGNMWEDGTVLLPTRSGS